MLRAIAAWFEFQWWYWIEAPQQVRAGAELLDEHKPKWFRRVRLNELCQRDCTDCVLAQVYGRYGKGLVSLGVGLPDLYGFDLAVNLHDYGQGAMGGYRRLTRLWDNEILARTMDDILENSRRNAA